MTRLDLAKLRRELADRGLTYRPRCGRCGLEVAPKDWGRGSVCGACEAAEQAARREHEDATWGAWRWR